MMKFSSRGLKSFVHVVKMLETVNEEIERRYARSTVFKFSLHLTSQRRN